MLENVCRSCIQKVTEICEKCTGTELRTDTWCNKCKRATAGMCKDTCDHIIATVCNTCRRVAPEYADTIRRTKVARTQAAKEATQKQAESTDKGKAKQQKLISRQHARRNEQHKNERQKSRNNETNKEERTKQHK